jgi:hypothetical protein
MAKSLLIRSRFAMIALSILSLLAGGMLGMRFQVVALAPAIGLVLIAVAGVGTARGSDIASIVLAMIVAATCLQMGYLASSATRLVMAIRHAPRRHSIETPATATRQVIAK